MMKIEKLKMKQIMLIENLIERQFDIIIEKLRWKQIILIEKWFEK
jgi:hypothetical protein